ncbi:MAG: T9SS type A sorting domain-containing protein, partial [bacterium]
APIEIPATGGSFSYNIAVTNNEATPITCTVWADLTKPNGVHYGPVIGPVAVTIAAGATIDRDRNQNVPDWAPSGTYSCNGYVGVYPGGAWSTDSFPFEKLTTGNGPGVDNWDNSGESFEEWMAQNNVTTIPEVYSLSQNYPNPFNPLTTITFSLPEAAQVKLAVYDLQGRMVAELVNGMRAASLHNVTWDASRLASGLYFYRIEAGDFSSVKKMVLVK